LSFDDTFRDNSDAESDGDTISPKNNSATNTPFKRFILQTQRMYFLNLTVGSLNEMSSYELTVNESST
jgi:hypothetical protein